MCEGMRKVADEVNLITPMPGLNKKYLKEFYNIKKSSTYLSLNFKRYPLEFVLLVFVNFYIICNYS